MPAFHLWERFCLLPSWVLRACLADTEVHTLVAAGAWQACGLLGLWGNCYMRWWQVRQDQPKPGA